MQLRRAIALSGIVLVLAATGSACADEPADQSAPASVPVSEIRVPDPMDGNMDQLVDE